jgi:hypothetical protein
MLRKSVALFLAIFLFYIVIADCGQERLVSRERLIAQIESSSWIEKSLKVSPDSRRLAYVAWAGDKRFVVVDGKQEKQYDGIITKGVGTVIFDFPDSLHYLAIKGKSIYLVEARIE